MQQNAAPGSSVLAGCAHAATQNETEKQLDAGEAQTNSDNYKKKKKKSKKLN